MKAVMFTIVGIIYGALMSMLFSFLFVLFGQGAAGGFTLLIGEAWLYIATFPIFMLVFVLLGFVFISGKTFNKKSRWIYSCIIAFFVTFYVSTIGSIVGHHLLNDDGMGIYERYIFYKQYSSTSDNVFFWGIIYAVVLLPITTVVAKYFIYLFEWTLTIVNRKMLHQAHGNK